MSISMTNLESNKEEKKGRNWDGTWKHDNNKISNNQTFPQISNEKRLEKKPPRKI